MPSSASASSTLLNDVLANFLSTLSEREFFSAFEATLRANGFYDVHLLHGQMEYGKDFLAKRTEDGSPAQYAIQTKVGDIGGGEWRAARDQIETIRHCRLSHPADDQSIPRRAVLASTGRLVGTAPAQTQDYKQQVDTAAFEFEVWPLDKLLSMMTDAPEAGLAGEPDAPLLGAVAAIFKGTFTEESLEELSRGWSNPTGDVAGIWHCGLSAFVLAHRLGHSGRLDLAALVGAHLVRAAWARCANSDPPSPAVIAVADAGRGLLAFFGERIFAELTSLPETATQSLMVTASFADFVVYPVRSMRIVELVALTALATEDEARRAEMCAWLRTFVQGQPGASHPISDHWAVSIPAAALVLYSLDPELLGKWLEEICVWVVDHGVAGRAGLAAPWTPATEEVAQWLISGFGPTPVRRRESFLAAVLLDLAAALELADIYDAIVNEVMAGGLFPSVVDAAESTGFYQESYGDVFVEPWVQYDGHYSDVDGWQCSEPHRNMLPSYLQRIGRPWDLLALSVVLRDRWFPLAWRDIVGLV